MAVARFAAESGGYGHHPITAKIEIHQRILHEGEVNRARYMPQNPFFVATKSPGIDVYVFDTSKHPSDPGNNKTFSPDIRCAAVVRLPSGLSCPRALTRAFVAA